MSFEHDKLDELKEINNTLKDIRNILSPKELPKSASPEETPTEEVLLQTVLDQVEQAESAIEKLQVDFKHLKSNQDLIFSKLNQVENNRFNSDGGCTGCGSVDEDCTIECPVAQAANERRASESDIKCDHCSNNVTHDGYGHEPDCPTLHKGSDTLNSPGLR